MSHRAAYFDFLLDSASKEIAKLRNNRGLIGD